MKPIVLVYHRLVEGTSDPALQSISISVEHFERQMRYLFQNGFRCLSATDILEQPGRERWNAGKAFVLTFDDGYSDFYELTFPILMKYEFTATVFLVSRFVGRESDWGVSRGYPLLTWSRILEMNAHGISFGSHTTTHPRLSRLTDDKVRLELRESKETIEQKLGQPISSLAYPFGDSSEKVRDIAASSGYRVAFGVDQGRQGPYNLWRYECYYDDNLANLLLRLHGFYYYPRWIRQESPAAAWINWIRGRLNTRFGMRA